MNQIPDRYTPILICVLDSIENEYRRVYWNKNQKELLSPFQNTGTKYANETFKVKAYSWSDDDTEYQEPNFVYKNLNIVWYKHSHRGTAAYFTDDSSMTLEFLVTMLNDCITTLRKDFDEK